MPTIESHKGITTQINVFTVEPERQRELVALLTEAANAVSDVPGWLSASLHASLDGTRVVNYAQCESYEAWERVMVRLREGGYLDANKKLGIPSPGLYEVVYTLEVGAPA